MIVPAFGDRMDVVGERNIGSKNLEYPVTISGHVSTLYL
jgi:hypothetical protein